MEGNLIVGITEGEILHMNLDTEARVDAAITFYEDCNMDKFIANEKRYKNLLNSADITEPQYNAVVEAHNKRKVELTI